MFYLSNVKCLFNEPPCTSSTCIEPEGQCIDDICLCSAGYTTIEDFYNQIPEDSIKLLPIKNEFSYCNYDYKYKEWAAWYEAILPFGIGHFYSLRYIHGIIKFLMYWFLSFCHVIFKKKVRKYPELERVIKYTMWAFAMLYAVDYIGFTFSFYQDGNGMKLL